MTNEADTVKVELKNCPFCGANGAYVQKYADGHDPAHVSWRVHCVKCSASAGTLDESPAEASETWNRRLAHEAEGKVEALDQPARLEQAVRAFEEVTGKLALPMTQKAIGAACVAYEHASPQAVRARVIEAGQLLSLAERLHYKGRIAPTVSEHDAYFEKASVLARAAEILADNSLKMPTREWMREKIAADPEEGIFNV